MDTRVTKLLGIKHPIIQGAMARIAGWWAGGHRVRRGKYRLD